MTRQTGLWWLSDTGKKGHEKVFFHGFKTNSLVDRHEREVGFKGLLILRRPRKAMVLDSVHVASL